ncbi:MAG TPA: phosphatase PAP2 family protein, partial [Bacteroidia bacterium]|nr:phosphatase PAP2 family protein [Bacteroidia bacterium]
RAVPVIAYSLASLVAVSRLIEHEHWASDLLPGAAIGYACGRQVVHYYEKLFPSNSTAKKNRTTSAFFFTNSNGIRAHFSLIF